MSPTCCPRTTRQWRSNTQAAGGGRGESFLRGYPGSTTSRTAHQIQSMAPMPASARRIISSRLVAPASSRRIISSRPHRWRLHLPRHRRGKPTGLRADPWRDNRLTRGRSWGPEERPQTRPGLHLPRKPGPHVSGGPVESPELHRLASDDREVTLADSRFVAPGPLNDGRSAGPGATGAFKLEKHDEGHGQIQALYLST